MAFDAQFKMFLFDVPSGQYYYATQDRNNYDSWNIYTTSTPTPLLSLPKDWDGFTIQWIRNVSKWWGVFRTQTTTFEFVQDARGILRTLLFGGSVNGIPYSGVTGLQAQVQLIIQRNNVSNPNNYDTIYTSNINFAECTDDMQHHIFRAPTLDCNLREKLDAYAGNNYNVSFWTDAWNLLTGTGVCLFATDVTETLKSGLKLLYNQLYTAGASKTNPISYTVYNVKNLGGDEQQHLSPSLNTINLVQDTGSDTVIGNRIMNNVLLQGSQQYEQIGGLTGNFFDSFTKNSYILWDLLPNGVDIQMNVIVNFYFHSFSFNNPAPLQPLYLLFNIYNIAPNTTVYNTKTTIAAITIEHNPSVATYAPISFTDMYVQTTNNPNFVQGNNTGDFPYVSFATTPNVTFINQNMTNIALEVYSPDAGQVGLTINAYDLCFLIYSQPALAAPASPVNTAPQLPASPAVGFYPQPLFNILTKDLFSNGTNAYGFPNSYIDYNGEYAVSDFLTGTDPLTGNPLTDETLNFDALPQNILITCGNSLRDISGIDYLNTSMDEIFKSLGNIFSLGLGIETDTYGVNYIRIEGLNYFFQNDTLILDLGSDVYGLEIKPLTTNNGNSIKTGYKKRPDNADYGYDSPMVETDFKVPVTRLKGELDYTVQATVDPYEIETARAEQNAKDQSSANSDNGTFLIHLSTTYVTGINIINPIKANVDPQPVMYVPKVLGLSVQNTDPITAPYSVGLLFPDTMYNIALSPARNLLRNGSLLHSIFDGLDSLHLSFIKQYQMMFNQYQEDYVPQLYPSITTNIGSGAVTEAADLAISNLGSSWGIASPTPNKLFRPFLIKITTKQDVNLYSIMNTFTSGTNPYGYIQFTVDGNVYRGFIYDVEQKVGNQAATTFTLLSCPDQTF